MKDLKKDHRRTKLPNTVTIDSIYQKKFLSLNSVLEAVIIDAFVLPGTLELKRFYFSVYFLSGSIVKIYGWLYCVGDVQMMYSDQTVGASVSC